MRLGICKPWPRAISFHFDVCTRDMNKGDMSAAPSDEGASAYRHLRRWIWLTYGLVLVFLAIFGWGSDFFSPKGERTLYTARCLSGHWEDGRCTGRLAASGRIRYKVQRSHNEVSYRAVGASSPAGHLTRCSISNGRNWMCSEDTEPNGSITLGLTNGKPDQSVPEHTRDERCVSKWTWFRLRALEKLS